VGEDRKGVVVTFELPRLPFPTRFPTRVVSVGPLKIGGDHPILIQSMTISDTRDTESVVREIRSLVDAGCPLVRLTAPSQLDAENLREIRRRLAADGIRVPMVADIHFTPNAALVAADIVEKVRINPGNYSDRKKFRVFEISDADYAAELERLRDELLPLVKKLKANGAALRIGTNHGSLSDRIMNRYGDTPEGMVESALEFARICEDEGYHDIVLSMKSSIPSVMIAAYRHLVTKMTEEGMNYPIHLGVTEAGNGLEGRVKSAIGIGSLLASGIGDTIRVSLTEDSHHELAAARNILEAVRMETAGPPAGAEAWVEAPLWRELPARGFRARRRAGGC
jgi:(E)-4-hydroxy-3-methylbut-2-enyl-diphosphate synthase